MFSLTVFDFPLGLDLFSGKDTPSPKYRSGILLDSFRPLGLPGCANVRVISWKGLEEGEEVKEGDEGVCVHQNY